MRNKVLWLVPVFACVSIVLAAMALASKPVRSQGENRADLTLESNGPVYIGEPAIFTATVTGTLPYTHAWNFDDGSDVYTDVVSVDPFSVSHTYEASGTYSVTVDVTDSVQAEYSGEVSMEVVPPFSDIILEHSDTPLAGEPVIFTATLEGGKAPFAYTWLFGDESGPVPGFASTDEFTVVHTYTAAGAFSATVHVTDALGTARSQDDHVLVACPDITVGLTDSGAAEAGQPVWFTVTVSGGQVPYSYLWDFDDGTPSEGDSTEDTTFSTVHSFGAGIFTVTLALTDAHGCHAPPASTQIEITNTHLYLPLVVRKAKVTPLPPVVTNGGFEEGTFAGWSQGGVLPRSVVASPVFSGTYSALLGDPALGDGSAGNVPVGPAWIAQTVAIPDGYTGTLILNYRLQGWDGLYNDRFLACATNVDTTIEVCYYDTFAGYAGVFKDTGWQTATIPLDPNWRSVEISLQNWNENDGFWNTWTYVDDVEVLLSE